MSSDLHWLYVHGATLSWGFVVAGGAAAIIAGALHATVSARLRARREAAKLGAPLERLEGAPSDARATFAGKLECGERLAVRRSNRLARRAGMGVRLGDGSRVALGEVVDVVAATVETPRRSILRDGDRVLARGRAIRSASAETGGDYRTPRFAVELTGAPYVELASAEPARAWPTIVLLVLYFFAGAAGGRYGAGRLGDWALAQAPGDGTRLDRAALAAATPSRRFALRYLREALENREGRAAREREAHVSFLLDDCHGAIATWIRAGDLPAASEVARSCPSASLGDAYVLLGDVDRASETYASTVSMRACSTHIAARRYLGAATCVRALAERTQPGDGEHARQRRQAMNCIADALSARAGDDAARERLRDAAPQRAMCRVLLADLSTPSERNELFASPQAAWAWTDTTGMQFAKGRIVTTAIHLQAENAALDDRAYEYGVSAEAVLGRPSWESQHRLDAPLCLMANNLPHIPKTAHAALAVSAGNLAQLHATLGERDEAQRMLDLVPETPGPTVDGWWSAPTKQALEVPILKVFAAPRSGSRLAPGAKAGDVGLFRLLDERALERRTALPASDSEALAGSIARLREALLRRETCVPQHMLDAFDDL